MADLQSPITSQHFWVEVLVKRFMQEVTIAKPGLIERCALVRWFDEDTLAKFIRIENTPSVMNRLSNLSIVESRDQGLAFHDLVRDMICQELTLQSLEYYKNLHREAANYYLQRSLSVNREMAQRYTIEMVYHLLRANEDEGIAQLTVILTNIKVILTNIKACSNLLAALLGTVNGLSLSATNIALVEHWKIELIQIN